MDVQVEQMSEKEREEIIRYGIKRGTVIFASTLITILMGWILGIFWQGITFWMSLSMLRKYAGGYHADTEKRCYVISFIVVAVSLFCIKLINYSGAWGIVLQTLSLLVILFLAPVENKNHILDKDEKRRYGIKTKMIAILICALYAYLYALDKTRFLISIEMACLVVALSLIAGYEKNKRG